MPETLPDYVFYPACLFFPVGLQGLIEINHFSKSPTLWAADMRKRFIT